MSNSISVNPTTTYAALKARFLVWLRDPTNITWTDAEVTELLNTALNDPYVYVIDYDSSLTWNQSNSYALPSQFTGLLKVAVDLRDDGFPIELDRRAWDLVNGSIRISSVYKKLPQPHAIYLTGYRQLTSSDNIPNQFTEYILHTAVAEAFEMLKTSLSSRFVKNDVTMAEIINSINTHRAKAADLRKNLVNKNPLVEL